MLVSKRFLIATAGLLLVLPARTAADEPGAKGLYGKAMRSLCVVRAGSDLATGWVVDELDRLIVTSAGVVGSRATVEVMFPVYRDGSLIAEADYYLRAARTHKARVVDVSARDHLALLQLSEVPAGARALSLAASNPGPGDRVHSVGNPGASEPFWLYAAATVRSVYRKKWAVQQAGQSHALDTQVIETQAPANAGDRGGPLLNDAGELVGVSVGETGPSVSRFVEVGRVRAFLADSRRLVLPLSADEFAERGLRQLRRNCLEAAVADFTRAIKRDPKNAWTFANRACAFNRRGDAATALADADRAVQLNPKVPNAYFERAYARMALKQYADAAADYTRVIQLQPESADARNNRGLAYRRLGRDQDALRDYSEAIGVDPTNYLAHSNRGYLLMSLKQHREAIPDFTRALAGGFRPTEMRRQRAWCYLEVKDYDAALADFEEGLKVAPNDSDLWVGVGAVRARKQDGKGAIQAYDRALALNPRNALAYFNRAWVHEALGHTPSAHRDYEAAARLNPAWAERAPAQDMTHLRIANKSNRSVRVYVSYENKTKDGDWKWWRTGPGESPLVVSLAGGETRVIFDGDWKLKARRVRLWAQSLDGTLSWRRDNANEDIWLTRQSYRAQQPAVFTYSLTVSE